MTEHQKSRKKNWLRKQVKGIDNCEMLMMLLICLIVGFLWGNIIF